MNILKLLFTLLLAFGSPLPTISSALSLNSTVFGYDRPNEVKMAYDEASFSAFDYDSAPVSIADDTGNRTGGTSGVFAGLDELDAAKTAAGEGTQLYRVFGNEARGLGNYYTTVNPGTVADFRTTAGLFPGNSGSFVLEGTLKNTEGVIFRGAAPGPGGVGGGLPEVFVPNPATQININRVSGVNPPF